MKRFLALAIGLAMITTACSKDDSGNSGGTNNNNPPASATLEEAMPGTWNVTEIKQTNGVSDFGGIQITFSGSADPLNAVFVFKEDASFTANGSYTMNLTMNFMGQTIPQSQPVTLGHTGSWSVNTDGKLVMNVAGEDPVAYDVVSRTANKVQLRADIQTTVEFQGQTSVSTLTSHITFEK